MSIEALPILCRNLKAIEFTRYLIHFDTEILAKSTSNDLFDQSMG